MINRRRPPPIHIRRAIVMLGSKKEKKPFVGSPKGFLLSATANFWVVQILKMFAAFL
jgi:hypothetical protein